MLDTAKKQNEKVEQPKNVVEYRTFEGVDQPILIFKAEDYEEVLSSGLLPDDYFVISSNENQEITPELVKMWQKFMPCSQLVIAICKNSDNIEIPISSAMKINI